MKTKEETAEAIETSVDTRRYLLSALVEKGEEALTILSKTVKDHDGSIEKSEDLGVKKLSFPINKKLELSLVSIFYLASPANSKTIESELKHEKIIERFLLTTWREDPNAQQYKKRKAVNV